MDVVKSFDQLQWDKTDAGQIHHKKVLYLLIQLEFIYSPPRAEAMQIQLSSLAPPRLAVTMLAPRTLSLPWLVGEEQLLLLLSSWSPLGFLMASNDTLIEVGDSLYKMLSGTLVECLYKPIVYHQRKHTCMDFDALALCIGHVGHGLFCRKLLCNNRWGHRLINLRRSLWDSTVSRSQRPKDHLIARIIINVAYFSIIKAQYITAYHDIDDIAIT